MRRTEAGPRKKRAAPALRLVPGNADVEPPRPPRKFPDTAQVPRDFTNAEMIVFRCARLEGRPAICPGCGASVRTELLMRGGRPARRWFGCPACARQGVLELVPRLYRPEP